MSANFDALLKPPRARSYAVMMMPTVMTRGEIHDEKDYTGHAALRQAGQHRRSHPAKFVFRFKIHPNRVSHLR
jgi:hypothetical protein